MIKRPTFLRQLLESLDRSPVVALLGPRQCGKTTLARAVNREARGAYFDLEHPRDVARLSQPMMALERREGLVILDEIQRKPELLECLRVLVDQPDCSARFLILGSASPRLIKGASESLAGRMGFVDLSPFHLREVGSDALQKLWLRGGFPRSFLAVDEKASGSWRDGFIRTFLERDIPQLGITIPAETMRRFWTMLAHYHGQIWNAAEFARSLGTAEASARRYLDILSGAYMVRQLPPWHENIKKRQIKSPKVYIRDSGLLHALLGLETLSGLASHPKVGASWEGFVIEQMLTMERLPNSYFWGTHAGAELDVLVMKEGRRIGFEVKYADAPRTTKSMRIAVRDLKLDTLHVVYPGREAYPLADGISTLPIKELAATLRGLGEDKAG